MLFLGVGGWVEKMDTRLHSDRTMCVVGPSHSGKTTFVMKLLEYRDVMFRTPIERIIWCYGHYQPQVHRELEEKGYILHRGIISSDDVQAHDVIVLDDLLNESKTSADMTSMFTQAAHHKPCFVIFITQNLYPPGREARTRSLNTHYYVLMKNPRDKAQIRVLAQQMMPGKTQEFADLYSKVTQAPHSYLFIDLTQECPEELRFRSHLFEKPMFSYKLN